jgi:AraC-like DNA-binding protein
LAKIATELQRALAYRAVNGTAGCTTPRVIARGKGWTVADVICTSGPQDRRFEEQHARFSVALVSSGTFQYDSPLGRALMTPGSMLLGNTGQCFECGHEHGTGDRCVSFWFSPEYFERLAAGAGIRGRHVGFAAARLPPLRELSSLAAHACAGLIGSHDVPWEEIGIELATRALQLSMSRSMSAVAAPPGAEARVTRVVRRIEREADAKLTVGGLARDAGLSPFHFLRTFERLTGVTPHQYIRRARLRAAAVRLALEPARVLDIALDAGFGDVSNFNHAFRDEFGVSPRQLRRGFAARTSQYDAAS